MVVTLIPVTYYLSVHFQRSMLFEPFLRPLEAAWNGAVKGLYGVCSSAANGHVDFDLSNPRPSLSISRLITIIRTICDSAIIRTFYGTHTTNTA